MSDKIVLVDFANQVWRANVGFSKPGKPSHAKCDVGMDCIHWGNLEAHCICGQNYNLIDDRCSSQHSEEFIVIYNFFRNLRPLIEQFQPIKCFIVLEGHPQFRYDLYGDYKANRIVKTAEQQETKDKLHRSQDEILRLLKYLPITIAKAKHYEADDLIGTLAEDLKEEDITIITGDNDYIQLLQRGYVNCKVYNPFKKCYLEAPKENFIALKSIMGDKSDNIKGLTGPKTATKLLNDPDKFKSFLDKEENRANFNINRKLVEFAKVPKEEIEIESYSSDYVSLKNEFNKMLFVSITNDKSWDRYVKTFECIKY
jgi:5'-3' exonuclease